MSASFDISSIEFIDEDFDSVCVVDNKPEASARQRNVAPASDLSDRGLCSVTTGTYQDTASSPAKRASRSNVYPVLSTKPKLKDVSTSPFSSPVLTACRAPKTRDVATSPVYSWRKWIVQRDVGTDPMPSPAPERQCDRAPGTAQKHGLNARDKLKKIGAKLIVPPSQTHDPLQWLNGNIEGSTLIRPAPPRLHVHAQPKAKSFEIQTEKAKMSDQGRSLSVGNSPKSPGSIFNGKLKSPRSPKNKIYSELFKNEADAAHLVCSDVNCTQNEVAGGTERSREPLCVCGKRMVVTNKESNGVANRGLETAIT